MVPESSFVGVAKTPFHPLQGSNQRVINRTKIQIS